MASLRKKPPPDVVSTPDAAPPVETNADAPPEPAPMTLQQDDASTALKRQLDALRQTETLQQQAAAMQAAQERRHQWLASNEAAQKNYAALNALHGEALQSGLTDTSPEYFDFLNNRLAALQSQHPSNAGKHLINEMQQLAAQNSPPEPPAKPAESLSAAHVSAPVSREVPSASGHRSPGKVTLTAAHLEAAKIAGVSPTEYARQLVRLQEMQASGEYSERR